MPLETRSILHQAAKQTGLGHKAFTRPIVGVNNNDVIEQALDEILDEMGDDSKYVEYWSRQEWRSIEAHADVDESLAKQQDDDDDGAPGGVEASSPFRYPNHGHVLYLQVGTHVRGPTCVFPDRKSGGDLLRPMTTETHRNVTTNQNHHHSHEVPVVTVPAVPGRVLRFDGSYLHAVPRPVDLWLLKFTQGVPAHKPEEEWGRSVILFNTWGDNPPLDVPLDDHQAHHQSTTEVLARDHGKSCAERDKWTEVYSSNAADADADAEQTCTTPEEEEKPLSAKVWLLGNERRRDYAMRTVKLAAPESLRTLLTEESRVGRTILERPRSTGK